MIFSFSARLYHLHLYRKISILCFITQSFSSVVYFQILYLPTSEKTSRKNIKALKPQDTDNLKERKVEMFSADNSQLGNDTALAPWRLRRTGKKEFLSMLWGYRMVVVFFFFFNF